MKASSKNFLFGQLFDLRPANLVPKGKKRSVITRVHRVVSARKHQMEQRKQNKITENGDLLGARLKRSKTNRIRDEHPSFH